MRCPTASALLLVLPLACDRPPSSDQAREWTAEDHDQAELAGKQGMGAAQPRGGGGDQGPSLVELTWSENCAACHGMTGRGDGPNGALVKAPDLTRADWQDGVKDEEIAARIKNGKGMMPKFDIPDSTVAGLVARIRASKGK